MEKLHGAVHASNDMQVITTNGAPWQDTEHYPLLLPYDLIVVYGPPGKQIVANVIAKTAQFLEAQDAQDRSHAQGQIGEAPQGSTLGSATFHLYMDSSNLPPAKVLNLAATEVTVADAQNANDYIGGLSVQFMPYRRLATNTVILGYGSNSGAPADGQTFGSVYIAVDTHDIDKKDRYVTVQLVNPVDAWIDGFGDKKPVHKIPLNMNKDGTAGTATANILASTPQRGLRIRISTPAPQDYVDLKMDFVSVPTSI